MPVLVKICGITTVDDAVAAARLGADFIGLNFYPGSPRCISEGQARLIVQALPSDVTPVGLFVNETWARIHEITARLKIDTIQIHGDQVEPCPLHDRRWIPAIPVRDKSDFDALAESLLRTYILPSFGKSVCRPIAILMDAHVPGAFGGTGRTAPWELIASYRFRMVMLAGGLTPDNVAEAVRIVHPWAVDVAGGVESAPGKKDHDKMRRFIENARAV